MTDKTQQTDPVSEPSPLTAADLLSPMELRRYEVQALDNRPVWIRDVPAGAMLEFMMIDEDGPERNEGLLKLIASSVTDENGCPLFDENSPGTLKSMQMSVFTELATAVTNVASAQVSTQLTDDDSEDTVQGED